MPTSHQWLAAHLSPKNLAFWRYMLVERFDFTVDEGKAFNVDGGDQTYLVYPEDPQTLEAVAQWEKHHVEDAYENFLDEDLKLWTHLGVYFRPSQHGFLSRIKAGEASMEDWPDQEDPYTLFCDLELLTDKFGPSQDKLHTYGVDKPKVSPCLLSRMTTPRSHRGYELLEHCGINPQYWEINARPVSMMQISQTWIVCSFLLMLPKGDTVMQQALEKTPAIASSTLLDAFTAESAIFQTVLSFVPVDTPSEAIQTLANISLALPSSHQWLAAQVNPSNRSFWQFMLFKHFDFTVVDDKTLNVDGNDQAYREDITDPKVLRAVAKWEITHGADAEAFEFLDEDFEWWKGCGVYFRPSQYGFLGEIQSGEASMDEWPEDEDPFTLFCDLALLADRFSPFQDTLQTFSDGWGSIYPCLLSRMAKPRGLGRGFRLLKHCGINPHYWALIPTPVRRWAKFGGGPGGMYRTSGVLPYGTIEDTEEELQELVLASVSDWRCVKVNLDEYCGTVFYVGPSNPSGRWIGFIGKCTV
ncbi:hypothetical protein Poli38472_013139 [Pythium oligandrum]|uniref:Uncharacterized protein n=1 Tax=Pythium oligandrum TaxID=41045 RepID=A0A8K1C2H8_PYTOL|nr:hypothetical protein Poli38472_013139 [Pythium oligandrum]|eukprot:TMW55248.1 hypothetical protein Poli38472_013139 [Pythium oligandrum]